MEKELQKPTFSQPGDIWILGRHRVVCGDSTVAETYTKLMDGQKANLVLTDHPYNVDVEETAGKIMNDNMSDGDFYHFLLAAYKCMYDSLADDGSIYVWHADTEGLNFRKARRRVLRHEPLRGHGLPQRLLHLERLGCTGARVEIPAGREHRRSRNTLIRKTFRTTRTTGSKPSTPSPFTRFCRSSSNCGDSTWRRRRNLKKTSKN